jgi:hypothetical protein
VESHINIYEEEPIHRTDIDKSTTPRVRPQRIETTQPPGHSEQGTADCKALDRSCRIQVSRLQGRPSSKPMHERSVGLPTVRHVQGFTVDRERSSEGLYDGPGCSGNGRVWGVQCRLRLHICRQENLRQESEDAGGDERG